ncbi:DUF397 domain-containing protein [Nocardiopsis sp. CC223A]|uniref:DUF397 domain-containing protein n=1 Tax=Nocardiopsis sp. CC223A TaxID=3044051 RepID=UPI00278BE2AB|nr:DUF397 domain-containing protein [Nocardiopsis sp. CC223A]
MPETSHPMTFRKSSYSGGQTQDCVEVADLPSAAALRDSKHPEAGHLTFETVEWTALLKATMRG